MPFTVVDWVDGVTPVDAANMDRLEAGVAAAVEKDSVVPAATRLVASKLLAGDANPAFKIQGDGQIQWGAGGASAYDAVLGRVIDPLLGGAVLWTPNTVQAAGPIVQGSGNERVGLGLNPGSSSPPTTFVGLYYDVGGSKAVLSALSGGVAWRPIEISPNNKVMVSQIDFGSAGANYDTNLYRAAANVLKTGARFDAATDIYARPSAAAQTIIGSGGPGGEAGIKLGSASDTNLYRAAANVLKTDDSLEFQSAFSSYVADGVFGASAVPSKLLTPANNELRFGYSDLGSGQYFPSLGFRVAPTAYNGALEILQARRSDEGNNRFSVSHDGHLNWGAGASALDTNLYRDTSNPGIGTPALRTNRPLITEHGLQAFGGADPTILIGYTGNRVFQIRNSGRLEWGPGGTDAVDTNLYRSAANVLKTDDTFDAAGFTVGGVPLVSGGMTLLNEQILAATASTITFNAIPAGYRKIEIIMEAVPTGANNEVTNFYFDVIPAAPGNWTYATVGQGAGNGSASNANNLHLGTVYYHTAMGAATHQWFCQMEMALGYDQATRHALFYKTISRIGVAGTGGDVGMLRGAAQVRANATHVAITGFTLTSDRAMGIGTRVAVYGVM